MDASAEKQNSKPDISIKDDPKAGTKRIWEIHQHLKCPLVGMCLSLEEHKRILKKTGNRIKGLSSHELHRSVMSHLDGQNRVSQKANRYLLHKYRIDLA